MSLLTTERYQHLMEWLHSLADTFALDLSQVDSASSDASFRRYYRISSADTSYIAMDAPPSHENNDAFIDVQKRLAAIGAKVPQILAYDAKAGFLLLSDLGTQNYYDALQNTPDSSTIQAMYRLALEELVRIQKANTEGLPTYTAERMLEELQLFEDWYINQHCKTTLSEQEKTQLQLVFERLVADNVQHGQVLVLRDFHSPNIMMPTDSSLQPGIIDFQDALIGPITYDLASLIMDARYTWDEEQQLDWAIRYWQAAHHAGLDVSLDFNDFHQAYEWMSLQRNLRILGVFSRLSIRDNKHHYLDHIPRVLQYIRQVAVRYEEFNALRRLLDRLENKQTVLGITI